MHMNLIKRGLLCFVLIIVGVIMGARVPEALAQGGPPAPGGADPAKKEEALPVPLSGFQDEGVFLLYVNEDRIGSFTFKWQPDGTVDAESTLSMAGQTVTQAVRVVPDKEGRWQSIALDTPLGPVTVVREGNVAKSTFKDKTQTIALKPGSALYGDTAMVLFSHSIRLFDKARGGKQTIPLFIIPGAALDVPLELKDSVERTVGGRDLKFNRFVYHLPGVDITLWADEEGKIYLMEIPSQHAAVVREGFEALRKAPEADPLVSQPKFEVRLDRGVGVPMRDGLKLSTDIYRPEGEGRFPVILVRTPYKKEMLEIQGRYYARRGYAFAVQDCRGRFGSPGVWEPFVNEAKDGHDAVEWLAARPWSSGKVGMIGGSYLGWVQWWAARERPPHLVTIIPNVSPPDPFYNIPYEYGAFFLWGAIWWADVVQSEATGDLSGAALGKIFEKKYDKLLRALPVIDLDKSVLGKENPYWRKWIEHSTNDRYWDQANFLDHLKDVRIPVFHQSGWFDGDGIGTKLNYLRMQSHGHPNQKLVLGPWGHTDQSTRMVGDRDMGEEALMDMQRAYLRWFDYWLKGIDNGVTKEPLVNIFVMGTNKWLTGDVYPLRETRFDKWYLSSKGRANTSAGDGRLSLALPSADSVDRYTYDPGDPTPSPNFYVDPDDERGDGKADAKKEVSSEEAGKKVKAFHENLTRSRSDILAYVTEPFTQPYTFAGPVSAVLYASSSARDTDWFMRLVEIDKDGGTFQLAEGKIRARYRNSSRTPEMLTPGKVYQYTLDLWQTGITIPAGHRLRVEVSSASFPIFSRNLNTGGHNEKETKYVKANQVIYHGRRYPSHLLLPAIPEKAR
ncbi:MAG TPA: CocE/NonD family hydrolase [Blastocatellia bacterium]|nr:CocE/NonD family hydrolase [Blastocatellia bacterium]